MVRRSGRLPTSKPDNCRSTGFTQNKRQADPVKFLISIPCCSCLSLGRSNILIAEFPVRFSIEAIKLCKNCDDRNCKLLFKHKLEKYSVEYRPFPMSSELRSSISVAIRLLSVGMQYLNRDGDGSTRSVARNTFCIHTRLHVVDLQFLPSLCGFR